MGSPLLKKTFHFLKNKYVLTLLLFIIWLLLFDSNNLLDRMKQVRELNQLKNDKEYYQKKIKEDTRKLKELETDDKSLEKFAREQYLMKKKNEDLFIVIDKDK
ncbi:MAG: septum formation initiator family protein [Bacteroidales bacterium]|nr:septum formation initiator family protein [Bacteroidales bacterium]